MARFNDITRELQTLLNQPDWKPEDKTHLTTRIQTLLATLSAHLDPYDPEDSTTRTSTPPPKANSSPSSTKNSAPKTTPRGATVSGTDQAC